jgi:hypothetical protein
MEHALATRDDTIETPALLPTGVTRRQWRLAALLPRCESAWEALQKAGYSLKTARASALRTRESAGVKLATEALEKRRADSARGLAGMAQRALAAGAEKLDDLGTQEKLGFGLKAMELAHTLGENLEAHGDGDAWKRRVARACLLMARLTELRLDPTRCSAFATRNRTSREKARGY